MGLDSVVRAGIRIADKVTKTLQADVTLEAWTGTGRGGVSTFAAAVAIPALVEIKQRLIRDTKGNLVMSRANVTFTKPIVPNGATGRREPVDPRDKITLPDEETGLILDVEGMTDPSTSAPYMLQIFLGAAR